MNEILTMRVGDLAIAHCVPEGEKKPFPILFVHGAWLGKWTFEHWQRYAAERGWESYALDLRGHHESGGDLAGASISDYADDVERVIEQIGECYLVGHSMGGLVAQVVASRNGTVKKAVFAAASSGTRAIYINEFVIRTLKYIPQLCFAATMVPGQKDLDEFFNDHIQSLGARLVPESMRALREILFGSEHIEYVSQPTLVIAAQNDRVIPAHVEKKIAAKHDSLYREISDIGHMLMLENGWERPIEEILRWLANP